MEFLFIVVIIGLIITVFWLTVNGMKESENHWTAVENFRKEVNKVSEKTDIEKLYYNIQEYRRSSYNKYVNAELIQLEAYLKGLYKAL